MARIPRIVSHGGRGVAALPGDTRRVAARRVHVDGETAARSNLKIPVIRVIRAIAVNLFVWSALEIA
jgi:hypothetical protein